MNVHVLRGLARDAFHQVLDNSVFRILAVLSLVPVLLTFVVGLREDHVSILFGLKTFTYDEVFGIFSSSGAAGWPDPQGLVIEGVLAVVFEFLAGSLGMLFALAATAFFVPRMLEKGAAEILFQRPVSRTALYLSRYFAGLVFVAGISVLLVVGMFLGLYLVSGHSDPGILMSAFELTYVFALIHAFSMLAGVVTRSTVGSLILSALFFFSNGCIHNAWITKETFQQTGRTSPGAEDRVDEVASEEPAPSGVKAVFLHTLDGLHYLLPKTTDAPVLSRKLREGFAGGTFVDETSGASLTRLPDGFRRLTPADAPPGPATLGVPILVLEGDGSSVSLWRRPAETSESTIGGNTRPRSETTARAAERLAEQLGLAEAQGPERVAFGRLPSGGSLSGSLLVQGTENSALEALVYRGVASRHVLTLLVRAEGPTASAEARSARQDVEPNLTLDSPTPDTWYRDQLSFHAPLPFNLFFSIGSSLLFALTLLALGAWRLSRIDF